MTEKRFLELVKNMVTMDEEEWNASLKDKEATEFPNMLKKYTECMEALNHVLDLSNNDQKKVTILTQQILDQYDVDLSSIQKVMNVLGNTIKLS